MGVGIIGVWRTTRNPAKTSPSSLQPTHEVAVRCVACCMHRCRPVGYGAAVRRKPRCALRVARRAHVGQPTFFWPMRCARSIACQCDGTDRSRRGNGRADPLLRRRGYGGRLRCWAVSLTGHQGYSGYSGSSGYSGYSGPSGVLRTLREGARVLRCGPIVAGTR